MPYYLCIVGTRDNLLYEADLSVRASKPGPSTSAPEAKSSGGIFGFGSGLGTWTAPFGPKAATPAPERAAAPAVVEGTPAQDTRPMLQMIAHGALDVLEDKQFVDNSV